MEIICYFNLNQRDISEVDVVVLDISRKDSLEETLNELWNSIESLNKVKSFNLKFCKGPLSEIDNEFYNIENKKFYKSDYETVDYNAILDSKHILCEIHKDEHKEYTGYKFYLEVK